jgi:hypothetical protein
MSNQRINPPLVAQEPGDEADHLAELQLYWPHPCAEAWALDVDTACGGELEESRCLSA